MKCTNATETTPWAMVHDRQGDALELKNACNAKDFQADRAEATRLRSARAMSSSARQTAQDKGVHAFGRDSDRSAYAPNAHLASCIAIRGSYYTKVAEAALAGRPIKSTVWGGIKDGMNEPVAVGPSTYSPAGPLMLRLVGRPSTSLCHLRARAGVLQALTTAAIADYDGRLSDPEKSGRFR